MAVKSNKMGKIELIIPSWVASVWNLKNSNGFTLEKDVTETATVGELLTGLVSQHPEFRKLVFDPVNGKVNDAVIIFLNDALLHHPDTTRTKLSGGDTVLILPVYGGG